MKWLPLLLLVAGCDTFDYASAVADRPDVRAQTDCQWADVGGGFEQAQCSPIFAAFDASSDEWERGGVGDFDIAQTEIFGAPFYQLWYSGKGENGHDIGTAASVDGIAWQRHPWNPVVRRGNFAGAFDRDDASVACVAYDGSNGVYHLWYRGTNTSAAGITLGHATSTDGLIWNKDLLNPVDPLSGVDVAMSEFLTCDAALSEDVIQLWIGGLRVPTGLGSPEQAIQEADYVLAHASTTDGAFFDVTEHLVLAPSGGDAFDARGVNAPSVFRFGDAGELDEWWMLFEGYEELTVAASAELGATRLVPTASRIGWASTSSPDGVWERVDELPLPLDFSGADLARNPRVFFLSGRITTFFADSFVDPLTGDLREGIGLSVAPFPEVVE